MFYLLFGVMFGGGRPAAGTTIATYLLVTYATFGIIGAALFGFGVGVAIERGQGWMTLKRATPMPPFAYFFAKVVMAMAFGALIIMSLVAVGMSLGGVRLPLSQLLALTFTLILGAIPFCALGLAIGYFAGPNSSVAIVNLIFMPMAFASGLWIPVEMLPPVVRAISPFLPPFHLAQLALAHNRLRPRRAGVDARRDARGVHGARPGLRVDRVSEGGRRYVGVKNVRCATCDVRRRCAMCDVRRAMC